MGAKRGSHKLVRRLAHAADVVTWRRGTPAFERHVDRSLRTVDELRSRGHAAPNVLAILLVETFYRPRLVRAAEYLFWALASLLRRPGIDRLSVGSAQVQLIHWKAFGLASSTRFSRRELARVRDLEANYVACSRYLEHRGLLAEGDERTLALAYNGAARYVGRVARYAELIAAARGALAATG